MNSLRLDASVALRFFARRKMAFLVIVLTIAFALAANTTAFSVVQGFLFAELGLPNPDRVVIVWTTRTLEGRGLVDFNDAYPNYRLLASTTHSFSALGATLPTDVNWEEKDETRHLQGARVSASFFDVMQVRPAMGRGFTAKEEGPNAAPVVLISHALWQNAFSKSADVLGAVIRLNGTPCTIIGVLPHGFGQPTGTDVWLPFDMPQDVWNKVVGARQLTDYARLAPGVTVAAANRELQEFAVRAREAEPLNKDWGWRAQPLREALLDGSGVVVLFVQCGALVLLLLAICNLSSLLMAWSAEREREMAVRLAMGASWWRIMRQLLVQSFILISVAGFFALLLTWVALPLLQYLNPTPSLASLLRTVQLDWTTISFAASLVVLTAVLVGLIPMLQLRSLSLESSLRSESRGASASAASVRWQKMMVVFQAAFSVLILTCATLAAIGLQKVSKVNLGFRDEGRVGLQIEFPEPAYAGHEKRAQFVHSLEQHLADEPALRGYGLTTTLPVGDPPWGGTFVVQLPTGEFTSDPCLFHYRRVSPGYLRAMGIPLVEGRYVEEGDSNDALPVVVVSKALAEKYWPGQSALGRKIRRFTPADSPVMQVVGVVGNVRDVGANQAPGEAVYVPFAQVSMRRGWIVLHARGSIADAVAAGRRALRATGSDVAGFNVQKLETLSWQALALPRLQVALLGIFAVIAIGITGLGSFGVMSQLVGIREKELAIRAAVGATPKSLFRTVLGQNARLALTGVASGVAAAWAASLWLQSNLTNFAPPALLPFVFVASCIIVLTQLASYLPARRAAYLDLQLLTNG